MPRLREQACPRRYADRMTERPYLVAPLEGLAEADARVRKVNDSDFAELAELMVEAYRGTVDDEGGDLKDALGELRRTAKGHYGEPMRDAWLALLGEDGSIESAIVVTEWRHRPFVAFLFTHPRFKGKGHATALLKTAASVLANAGEKDLSLIVTRSNPARELYESLGFTEREAPALETEPVVATLSVDETGGSGAERV